MFFEVLVSLLGKHGVAIRDVNVTETGEVKIDIDFSEHDKVFEDKIAKLESEISYLRNTVTQYKEDCVKLEKELESKGKINLNDRVKVKLTPLGAEIYYHQYDELNKQIKERGGTGLEPRMPEIDKDGFTEFTLWHFMELYGEHIGMCKKNVIEPLYIELCQDEWKMRYNEEPIEKVKE